MPNLKISAMPGLGTGAAPNDLLTIVDVSAPAPNANKHETLNNLLSVITRGIADKAVRFQTPGSTPALSAAGEGGLYFDGGSFSISANGGPWTGLVLKGAVTGSGLTMGGPRLLGRVSSGTGAIESIVLGTGLAWTPGTLNVSGAITASGLTASAGVLLGRTTAGTGAIEEITLGANVANWISSPTSAKLLAAVTDATGTGSLVFATSPTLAEPYINFIRSSPLGAKVLQFAAGSGTPSNYLEIINATTASPPILRAAGSVAANVDLQLSAKGAGVVRFIGAAAESVNADSTLPGILAARGGSGLFGGGQLRLYERTTNGTNWVGFEAPDSLTSDLFWTLPATDGTAGQALVTDGGAGLSWATPSANPGGSPGEIQINNSGVFGGISEIVYNNSLAILQINSTAKAGISLVTQSDIDGSGSGFSSLFLCNPSNNFPGVTSNALRSVADITAGNPWIFGTLNSTLFELNHRGSGTLTIGRGALYNCINRSTGTWTNAYGITTNIQKNGTGNITNGYGIYIQRNDALNAFGVYVNGSWTNVSNGGSTTWATSSDARYKTDVVDYELGLAEILQYRPVRFTWNDKSPAAGKRKVGLIAQEAQLIDPDLVFNLPADEYYPDPLAMDAENITWQLVKAVQQLAARVVALETMETT